MSETFDWKNLDTSWADADTQDTDSKQEFQPVPDGPYPCVIDKVEFRDYKNGNPYLNWVLIIDGGPHDGRWLFKRNMLANSQNMVFLKKDIAACGVTLPDKLSDLELEALLDKKIKVTKKTKGDFENIYIDHLLLDQEHRLASGHFGDTPTQEYKDDDLLF